MVALAQTGGLDLRLPLIGLTVIVAGCCPAVEPTGGPKNSECGWRLGRQRHSRHGPFAPIACPSSVVQLLCNRGGEFGPHVGRAVGLYGAIEIRHHAGPMFLDRQYEVEGEVVAVGASPRTEYVWYDTRALDPGGGVVASMRMQLRWMTASSPLYSGGANP